jgi:hypothetical protein
MKSSLLPPLPPQNRHKSIQGDGKFQMGVLDFKSPTDNLRKDQDYVATLATTTDEEKERQRRRVGKANFTQCVFNLVNALMVRLLKFTFGFVCVFPLI